MSRKRIRARHDRRAFYFHERELKRFYGWHGRWTWEAHEALNWEAYAAKERAAGREPPDGEDCPF